MLISCLCAKWGGACHENMTLAATNHCAKVKVMFQSIIASAAADATTEAMKLFERYQSSFTIERLCFRSPAIFVQFGVLKVSTRFETDVPVCSETCQTFHFGAPKVSTLLKTDARRVQTQAKHFTSVFRKSRHFL